MTGGETSRGRGTNTAGKQKSETRSIQQVEEVDGDRHEPDGVFGPCEFNGTNGCYMVNVHRSEQEQVTTKVLNVLTEGGRKLIRLI